MARRFPCTGGAGGVKATIKIVRRGDTSSSDSGPTATTSDVRPQLLSSPSPSPPGRPRSSRAAPAPPPRDEATSAWSHTQRALVRGDIERPRPGPTTEHRQPRGLPGRGRCRCRPLRPLPAARGPATAPGPRRREEAAGHPGRRQSTLRTAQHRAPRLRGVGHRLDSRPPPRPAGRHHPSLAPGHSPALPASQGALTYRPGSSIKGRATTLFNKFTKAPADSAEELRRRAVSVVVFVP